MSALRSELKEDIVVVYFNDTQILDEARMQQIGKELMEKGEEVAKTASKKMLLSFRGVRVMSSAMFGKLVLLNKKAKSEGITLKFCEISPDIRDLFNL